VIQTKQIGQRKNKNLIKTVIVLKARSENKKKQQQKAIPLGYHDNNRANS